MKTAKEWLAHIKHASDTEVRHGSSVFLLESDIEAVQWDAFRQGRDEAYKTLTAWLDERRGSKNP